MCAIPEFHLPENLEQNLDILPQELLNDECIAFHGSSMLYADDVQENGLSRGGTPFPQEQGELIVGILDELEMPPRIDNRASPQIRIQGYLDNRGQSPLSFAFTAYEALYYATEARKGGQIYMAIRDAINWIDENHPDFYRMNELELLRGLLAEAENSMGCVYAVNFCAVGCDQIAGEDAFNDVAGTFYCLRSRNQNIPAGHIIAKIIVPVDYVVDRGMINLAKNKTKNKRMYNKQSLAYRLDPFRQEIEDFG